ncbi:hypothetical protein EYZ11_006249 [Aspergillus tanneri]|uniref:Uncharacterized protein n=1 Tax=Aspergillus tanneri TaxID=1220188 RepID=A0A4S3JFW9_9EURO|nr:uncharacterized protein ATNIH1004_010911 [Aspergillus tanneri]KAA8641972.1 hypothetical protein ATNIH1004_010911 [Aspergillus tanneri]THC94276.1 hypothetical protein EYZ11_006249 [Aspergillus tanneri]
MSRKSQKAQLGRQYNPLQAGLCPNQNPENGTTDCDSSLPAYSELPAPMNSTPPTLSPQSLTITPGLPPINLSQYFIPDASVSKDETTITISSTHLCTNESALTDFLTTQAALPPHPQIHLTGVHDVYGEREVDFDIHISLFRYLIPSENPPLNYIKIIGPDELAFRGDSTRTILPHVDGGLKEWARRFCHDSSPSKEFVLERAVPNWNTPLLEGLIRNLLASLKYQGRVTIEFPITQSKVVVTTQPQDGSILPRLLSLVRETKRYAVVQSVWPYANVGTSSMERDRPRRTCVVQSEEDWWDVWSEGLAAAIVEKRRGKLTLEDVMDRVMLGRASVKIKKVWGESS